MLIIEDTCIAGFLEGINMEVVNDIDLVHVHGMDWNQWGHYSEIVLKVLKTNKQVHLVAIPGFLSWHAVSDQTLVGILNWPSQDKSPC